MIKTMLADKDYAGRVIREAGKGAKCNRIHPRFPPRPTQRHKPALCGNYPEHLINQVGRQTPDSGNRAIKMQEEDIWATRSALNPNHAAQLFQLSERLPLRL